LLVLHKKDQALLELIRQYFNGAGNISKHRKDAIQYQVGSLKDLALVINHFDKYPLITQKLADYQLFKQVIELINRKEHLTEEGLTQIVSLRASINNGLSEELKSSFPNIIPVVRPKVELPTYINPYWLAGFVSAEGCFFVAYSQSSNFGPRVQLFFRISQHSRDAELMKSLVKHFGCGVYYSRHNRNEGEFQVTVFSNIFEYIMPFFNQYPIVGVKHLDYLDFCQVALIMKEGRHLTIEGLDEIRKIKSGMNSGRQN